MVSVGSAWSGVESYPQSAWAQRGAYKSRFWVGWVEFPGISAWLSVAQRGQWFWAAWVEFPAMGRVSGTGSKNLHLLSELIATLGSQGSPKFHSFPIMCYLPLTVVK